VTCPDFDVTGATFPGLPGFPHFGFNGSVAWAITHGDADTQDLYLERFNGTRYLTADGWQEAEVRHERIEVRGGSPVTVPVWATRHGPVVHGNPENGHALVLKWTHRAHRRRARRRAGRLGRPGQQPGLRGHRRAHRLPVPRRAAGAVV
jgi:penicillin amidase